MEVNNTFTSLIADLPYPSKTPSVNTNNTQDDVQEIKPVEKKSLEQISEMLQNRMVSDESGSRAKVLFQMQELENLVDSKTYGKMVDAVMNEKDAAKASMRYASFPNKEVLLEDSKMFHAMVETSLSMEKASTAVVFNLNLKEDIRVSHTEQPEDVVDFEELIELLKRRLFEDISLKQEEGEYPLSEQQKQGYSTLIHHYENGETSHQSLNILA